MYKHKTHMKNNKGFTLIELIAVIIVIVILAAIALPRIGDMRTAANNAQVAASQVTIATAIERAITEGVITSADTSATVGAQLSVTSPLSHVPYLNGAVGTNVVFGGIFPAFTVTVNPAPLP